MASASHFIPSPKPPNPSGVVANTFAPAEEAQKPQNVSYAKAASSSLPTGSYANVASSSRSRTKLRPRFPPLSLPTRQVGTKDGKPIISFSRSEIGACEKRFEYSIIAKFTVGRPNLGEMQRVFQSSWSISGCASLSEIWDSRHVLFIFDSKEDVRVALSSSFNKVGHAYF